MMFTSFPRLDCPSITIPTRTETCTKPCNSFPKKYSKGLLMTSMNEALTKYAKIKEQNRFDWLYPPIDWCYRSDHFVPPKQIVFTENRGKETINMNYLNQERAKLMKRREYNRLTSASKKPIYGTIAEKEAYRKNIRQVLKYQMMEKEVDKKTDRITISEELSNLLKSDIIARENQIKLKHEKTVYLRQFRDANKKLMEKKWADEKEVKMRDILLERNMLKFDPINWGKSLT